MAAMFDLPVAPTSESLHTSLTMLNVGVAFGISLLSSIVAEILRYFTCTSGNGGHLYIALTPMSDNVYTSPTELLDPENVGVAC